MIVMVSNRFRNRLPCLNRGFRVLQCIAAAVAFHICLSAAFADVYTYTDENGVVHFTNIKKEGRKYKRLSKQRKEPEAQKKIDVVHARDMSRERFTRYDPYIRGASRLYRIPEPLIRAIIKVESNFDPRVVSHKGAKGLMQMMDETARDMGVVNVFDPRENIYGATRYLRVLANMFNGDLILTIAAHHAGPGSVSRYKGIPPFKTTRQYIRAVMSWYYRFRTMTLDQILAAERKRREKKAAMKKELDKDPAKPSPTEEKSK